MSKARQLADLGNVYDDGALSNRNLIINGDMTIDQRNSGSSVTPTSSGYTLDRYQAGISQSSKFSVQQVSDAPEGFSKSLKVTSLAATTVGASDYYFIQQIIEGYNTAQLGFGASGAKDITASFWVKSSLTGTFGLTFYGAGGTRAYLATYTISVANTWEYKTISISGDTSGTWNTDNTSGLQLLFSLGVGTNNSAAAGSWGSAKLAASSTVQVVATNAATWQITGVQLEVGDTATPFEHRSYGDELARCQRYFTKLGGEVVGDFYNAGYITSSGIILNTSTLPVKMRTVPTGTKVGTWTVSNVSQPVISYTSSLTVVVYAAGTAIGQGLYYNPALTEYLTFDAEL